MPYTYSFEKLEVWQDARALVKAIYKISAALPTHEKYGLFSQMQRAAVSIASNIAEGSSRNSEKDQERFYEIAFGSLTELYCQLILCSDLEYINEGNFNTTKDLIQKTSNKLNALKKSIRRRG
jgi:four helix bundle protein